MNEKEKYITCIRQMMKLHWKESEKSRIYVLNVSLVKLTGKQYNMPKKAGLCDENQREHY